MISVLIKEYKYCAIGVVIAINCAFISIFKLEALYYGLLVLAFCCTLQFVIRNKEPAETIEKKPKPISEELFYKIINIVPETVYVSMFDGLIKYISASIEKLVGYKPDEICSTRNSLLQLIHPDDKEDVMQQIQMLQNEVEATTIEYRLLKKDGTYVWVSDNLNAIKNEWGNITHYNGILTNIDERKAHDKSLHTLNARIQQLNDTVNQHAVRDSLTNIYNKRYSLVILQNEFNRAKTQGKPLSCILMDIDHLESINNSYGYFIGDRILMEISQCLQRNTKSTDVVARFGDDEFLIILPEIDSEELKKISSSLAKEVEKCLIKDEEKNINIKFGTTSGISSVTPKTNNITNLVEQVTKSLHVAKKAKDVRKRTI